MAFYFSYFLKFSLVILPFFRGWLSQQRKPETNVELGPTPCVHYRNHSIWWKKVFWTWREKMIISSNMSEDISLLNIYLGIAMMELCLWSKKSAKCGFCSRKPPSSRQGQDLQLFFCAPFTSYYEGSYRGHKITAKKRLNRWIHTKNTGINQR